jgi:hypothetical protein
VRRFCRQIPQAGLYRYRFVNPFSDTVLIQPEIVDAPLLLPYIRYTPLGQKQSVAAVQKTDREVTLYRAI